MGLYIIFTHNIPFVVAHAPLVTLPGLIYRLVRKPSKSVDSFVRNLRIRQEDRLPSHLHLHLHLQVQLQHVLHPLSVDIMGDHFHP